MALATFELRAVTRTGTPIATFSVSGGDSGCNIHRYTRQLNRPGTAEFSINISDSKGTKLRRWTEIQIWVNDTLDWWGTIVSVRVDRSGKNGRVVFQCQGVMWYLFRRFVGKADRTNKCLNPSFETGTTANWAATATTATVDNVQRKTGTYSLKLVQSTTGADAYESQSISITSGGVGEVVTISAWYKIIGGAWVGPALQNRGLFIERVGSTDPEGVGYSYSEIDSETPRDVWRRAEVTVKMPRNVTETIRWRLYSPNGEIRWDEVTVTLMESLSYYNTDQTSVFANIVTHMQDTAYNKDNVGIVTDTPTSGVTIDWHSQFAEHRSFRSIVEEFTSKDNGFDIGMVHNAAGTTRTLTTYFPRKGSLKTWAKFDTFHVASYNYEENGENANTSITVLGEGDGPDREEGGAINVPAGWPVLEEVIPAPQDSDIDSLDRIANEELRVSNNPIILNASFNIGLKNMLGIYEGDTLIGQLDDGWVQTGWRTWRVVSKTVAPHKNQVTLELNSE